MIDAFECAAFEDFEATLRPGDVVLVSNDSRLAQIIRALDRCPYNHVMVCDGGGKVIHAFPAGDRSVFAQDLSDYWHRSGVIAAARLRPWKGWGQELLENLTVFSEVTREFAFDDLLVVAAVKSVAQELALEVDGVIGLLGEQTSWEALFVGHLGLHDSRSVTCAETAFRCLPDDMRDHFSFGLPVFPHEWRLPIETPGLGEAAREIADWISELPEATWLSAGIKELGSKLGAIERRGFDTELSLDELRVVVLSVHALLDRLIEFYPLDADRLSELAVRHGEVDAADLVTPGDFWRSTICFEPDIATWRQS